MSNIKKYIAEREDGKIFIISEDEAEDAAHNSGSDWRTWEEYNGDAPIGAEIKYSLENAYERHRQHPDTFGLPSQNEIATLKLDDYAKLIFLEEGNGERMWVQIEETWVQDGKRHFKGMLDNKPSLIASIQLGDKVTFTEEHIIATETS